MNTNQTDVVADYLREVDQRLAGLPVLQRRELLADLAAHIAGERAERNLTSEGEVIEVLERLGSPEVVAAAAHEEAGTRPQAARPRPAWRRFGPAAAIAAGILLVMLFLCGVMFFAQGGSSSEPSPPGAPSPAAPTPAEPAPTVTG